MAAEQLEKTGRELGHTIKVETQGAMGIENELGPGDLAGAEVAILACDIEIEKRERFAGLRILEISVQTAIKDPRSVFARLDQ